VGRDEVRCDRHLSVPSGFDKVDISYLHAITHTLDFIIKKSFFIDDNVALSNCTPSRRKLNFNFADVLMC